MKKYYYLLSTGAIFCCEEELTYNSLLSKRFKGLLSLKKSEYFEVNSFTISSEHIIASWTD